MSHLEDQIAEAIALRNREIVEKRLGIKLPTYR